MYKRQRKFSLQTNENKAVCAAHTRILDAMVQNDTQAVSYTHLDVYKRQDEGVEGVAAAVRLDLTEGSGLGGGDVARAHAVALDVVLAVLGGDVAGDVYKRQL